MLPVIFFLVQFADLARPAGGSVGAAATLIETGERMSCQGDRHFPMQSVYKLPIGMAVLAAVDRGDLRIEQDVTVSRADMVPNGVFSPLRDAHPDGATVPLRELLRLAVEISDGTASDVLLRLAGGFDGVNAYLRGLGVTGVVVATTENEMGHDAMAQYRSWASPDQTVILLSRLQAGAGLSKASRATLMQWLMETKTSQTRLKGLLPAGTVVAHKTGSSGTQDGLTRATNDVGLITLPDGRHIAIAVFVSDSKASAAVRDEVIAKIARAAWDRWVR
jgi:beta-lactamase class A